MKSKTPTPATMPKPVFTRVHFILAYDRFIIELKRGRTKTLEIVECLLMEYTGADDPEFKDYDCFRQHCKYHRQDKITNGDKLWGRYLFDELFALYQSQTM